LKAGPRAARAAPVSGSEPRATPSAARRLGVCLACFTAVAVLSVGAPAIAQPAGPAASLPPSAATARAERPPTVRKGATEWTLLAGGADAVKIQSSRADREFAMQALSWGRILSAPRGPGLLRGQLQLVIEVVPVFVMFQSQRVYGYGVNPMFFRWNFAPTARVQPFVEGS